MEKKWGHRSPRITSLGAGQTLLCQGMDFCTAKVFLGGLMWGDSCQPQGLWCCRGSDPPVKASGPHQ